MLEMRAALPEKSIPRVVGQVALAAVLHHADRAVALGEPLAVGAEDHRHVGELRQLPLQRARVPQCARGG